MPKIKPRPPNLMTIKEASVVLNDALGGGYSGCSIRKRIWSEEWIEGREYLDDRRPTSKIPRYKIDVDRVLRMKGINNV